MEKKYFASKLTRLGSLIGDSRFKEFNELKEKMNKEAGDNQDLKAKINLYVYILKQMSKDIPAVGMLRLSLVELGKLNITMSKNLSDKTLHSSGMMQIHECIKFNVEKKIGKISSKMILEQLKSGNYNINKLPVLLKYEINCYLNKPTDNLVNHITIPYNGWDHKKFNPLSPAVVYARYYIGDYLRFTELGTYSKDTRIDKELGLNDIFGEDFDDIHNAGDLYKINKKFKKLVPVLITMGDLEFQPPPREQYLEYWDKDNKYLRREFDYTYMELILWYYPTEEFINALPERCRKDLKQELNVIAKVEEGLIPEDKACEELNKEISYFGICGLNSQNFKEFAVYPNPVSGDKLFVRLKLDRNSIINIRLHDINGDFIQDLIKDKSFNIGEQTIEVPLKSKPNQGVYLISISNEAGERVVERVIIQ